MRSVAFRTTLLGLKILVLTCSSVVLGETLSSPDNRLSITFDAAEEEQLVYEVSYQGRPVIVPSKLGLSLRNHPVLGAGVKVDSARPSSHDETYETIHGKSRPVSDHYNALRLELVESGFGARRFAVDEMMEEAFPLYEKWGIKGVKIDFMDRDDQWMADWYHRVIELTATHHIMVNMHGAYKPEFQFIKETPVDRSTVMEVSLASGGGHCIRI